MPHTILARIPLKGALAWRMNFPFKEGHAQIMIRCKKNDPIGWRIRHGNATDEDWQQHILATYSTSQAEPFEIIEEAKHHYGKCKWIFTSLVNDGWYPIGNVKFRRKQHDVDGHHRCDVCRRWVPIKLFRHRKGKCIGRVCSYCRSKLKCASAGLPPLVLKQFVNREGNKYDVVDTLATLITLMGGPQQAAAYFATALSGKECSTEEKRALLDVIATMFGITWKL